MDAWGTRSEREVRLKAAAPNANSSMVHGAMDGHAWVWAACT